MTAPLTSAPVRWPGQPHHQGGRGAHGTPPAQLRRYEQIGLLPQVDRSHAGQRRFGDRDLPKTPRPATPSKPPSRRVSP
ncbi:MerR family DNA-binding transcriptional regulator [Streptomyces puniciscabiei]